LVLDVGAIRKPSGR